MKQLEVRRPPGSLAATQGRRYRTVPLPVPVPCRTQRLLPSHEPVRLQRAGPASLLADA